MTTLSSLIMDEQHAAKDLERTRDNIAYFQERYMTIRSIPGDSLAKEQEIKDCEDTIKLLKEYAVKELATLNQRRHALADYIDNLRTDISYPV